MLGNVDNPCVGKGGTLEISSAQFCNELYVALKTKTSLCFCLLFCRSVFRLIPNQKWPHFPALSWLFFFFLSNEVSKVSEELYTLNCFSFHVKTVLKINQQIGPSSKFFLFYGFSPSILFPTYILFLPPFLPLPLPSFPLSFLPSFFP